MTRNRFIPRLSILLPLGLAALIAAVPETPARAAAIGFSLTISGDANLATRETYELENLSDSASITGFLLSETNPAVFFDCATDFTNVIDTGAALTPTLNAPDTGCFENVPGSSTIDFSYIGFDAGDLFSFSADIDPNTSPNDWRQRLFGFTDVSVTFSNGAVLSTALNPANPTSFFSYTFTVLTGVPAPGAFALLGFGLLGIGMAQRRRT